MTRAHSAIIPWLLLAAGSLSVVRADSWPRWRGPDGNAVSSDSRLPLEWSHQPQVAWKTDIPGEGTSSPIVWQERVFVTSALEEGQRRVVHCLERDSGRIVWSRDLRHDRPEVTSAVTGHAAATPATDGQCVVASFGNAGLVCYDRDGKLLWHKVLGEMETELGFASSPILFRGRVFLVCDHDGDRFRTFDSFLIALDLRTGKEIWKTERPGLYRSWSTPIIVPAQDNRFELVVNAQDELRGYDPETGKQRWCLDGMSNWVTPSPVFRHGLVFATSGRNGPIVAVQPGGTGTVTPRWRHPTGGPYVCSPLVYGDYLYVPTEAGILHCYDARTGKEIYRERLAGKFTASPVAGAGRLYWTNEDGLTYVVRAGPVFEVLAQNALNEPCLASPAIAAGRIFLRTERRLYCLAE